MNIHRAVLQPIAAFVFCNRQAAAGRRRQAKVGNFACATELRPWAEFSCAGAIILKLFYDGTTREIK